MNQNCNKKLIIFDMEGTVVHEHEPLPWIKSLLELLKKNGLKLAVMTDLDEIKGKAILTEAGIDSELFDIFVSTTHYDEAFRSAAEKCGADLSEAVVCSGSAVGIKIASRCGAYPVAMRTYFAKEFYIKAGAKRVCDDLMELADFLGLEK